MKMMPNSLCVCALLILAVSARSEELAIAIPVSLKALWAETHAKNRQLTEVVAAKNTDQVYNVAKDLEALLKALSSKSSSLPADELRRVAGLVKNAGIVLDDLHDAAKKGKYEVAQEKLTIVDGVIKASRAQYSADETGAY